MLELLSYLGAAEDGTGMASSGDVLPREAFGTWTHGVPLLIGLGGGG